MMDIYLSIIKVFLFMLGIAAVIIFTARYAGKLKLPLGTQDGGYGLKKMGSIYLGYRKFVTVVEVKDHVLVIGAGDKEIALLAQWKKEEEQA